MKTDSENDEQRSQAVVQGCADVEDKVTPHKRLKMDWLHEVDE